MVETSAKRITSMSMKYEVFLYGLAMATVIAATMNVKPPTGLYKGLVVMENKARLIILNTR